MDLNRRRPHSRHVVGVQLLQKYGYVSMAIAEKNVNHPLAEAIVAKAQEKQIEVKMDNSTHQSRIRLHKSY